VYPQTSAAEQPPKMPVFLGLREKIAQRQLSRIESQLGELAHSYAVNRFIGENLLTGNDYNRLFLSNGRQNELRPQTKKELATARRLGKIVLERGNTVGLLHSMESHPGNTINLSGGEYPSVATMRSTGAEDKKYLARTHRIHDSSSKKATHLDHEFVEIISEPLRQSEKLREKQGKTRSKLRAIQTSREDIRRSKQQRRIDRRAARALRRGIRNTRP
jgi:hypothetical protein